MFAEAARPAFGAMMVDVVPERDRLRAFSLNYWAINLGFACAAVLAGLAAEAGYLLLFVVDAVTTLVTALIIFVRVRETRRAATTSAVKRRDGWAAPRRARCAPSLADRVFLGFVVLNLFGALVFLQHISMLPIAMGDAGLSPATYGSVIALNGVLIVVGPTLRPPADPGTEPVARAGPGLGGDGRRFRADRVRRRRLVLRAHRADLDARRDAQLARPTPP